MTLSRLLALTMKLATSVGAIASGLISGSLGYGLALTTGTTSHVIGASVFATLGFVIFASVYVLIGHRPYYCLEKAHLMFVDGCISRAEYNLMRKKCFETYDLT
jgi:hypothetical protein